MEISEFQLKFFFMKICEINLKISVFFLEFFYFLRSENVHVFFIFRKSQNNLNIWDFQ